MITVSNDFKTSMKASSKRLEMYVYDSELDEYIRQSDDLKRIFISTDGDFYRTVMRRAEFDYFGAHSYLGKSVKMGLGVELPSETVEYIDYGSFKVTEIKQDKYKDFGTAILYDLMYESLRRYSLPNITYPITLLQLLQTICDTLGWTLGTTDFIGNDMSIEGDLFVLDDPTPTFRDVLNRIAEAIGGIILFDNNDELIIVQPEIDSFSVSPQPLEIITASEWNSLDLQEEWGAVNSFVIAEQPGEFFYNGGYVYAPFMLMNETPFLLMSGEPFLLQRLQEDPSIDIYQIRFENNPILLNDDPEILVEELGERIKGLSFYPHTTETNILGYFQVGDYVTIEDREEVPFGTYILGTEIELSVDTVRETLWANIPEKSREIYNKETPTVINKVLGAELDTKNYKDESVTDAKVRNISADKIQAGTIQAEISIGAGSNGNEVVIDGVNQRLVFYKNGKMQAIFGRNI